MKTVQEKRRTPKRSSGLGVYMRTWQPKEGDPRGQPIERSHLGFPMRVVIVASISDRRSRWRFIYEPLSIRGNYAELIMVGSLYDNCRALSRMLKTQKTEAIVIFVGCSPSMVPLLFVCKWRRLNIVLRLGGNAFPSMLKSSGTSVSLKLKNSLENYLKATSAYLFLTMTRRYIVVNENIISLIKRYIPKGSSWFVVPQYQIERGFQERQINFSVKRILTVTNLDNLNKANGVIRIVEMLEAFCSDKGIKLELLIAGEGVYSYKIKNLEKKTFASSGLKIRPLGFCGNIEAIHRSVDIFVYNSTDDATPNALIEAKRLGTPILVNAFDPFKFLVADGVSGMTFNSYCEFVQKLESLVHSKYIREKLADRGRQEFNERFSVEAVADVLQTSLIEFRDINASR